MRVYVLRSVLPNRTQIALKALCHAYGDGILVHGAGHRCSRNGSLSRDPGTSDGILKSVIVRRAYVPSAELLNNSA